MTLVDLGHLFFGMKGAFARRFPEVRGATLTVVPTRCPTSGRCASRDLAWMEGGHVFILRRALRRSDDVVAGLLADERGHAVDARVHEPGSEQRADDLAELVLGRKVRYDRNNVQTLGRGTWPRPSHLHQ